MKSSQGGAEETCNDEVDERDEDPLEQNFKILEQEWSFFKKMSPRNSQCSVDSDDCCQSVIESSPGEVMSSLQQRRRLPSDRYICNWKPNDRAAVEILKDRWHAIHSGKLKGRRLLFEDLSSGETEEDICCKSVQESEGVLMSTCGSYVDENSKKNLATDFSFCCSSSSSESEGRVVVGREKVLKTNKMEVKSGIGGMVGYRKIWLGVVIAWLGVIFALCLASRNFNGGCVEEVMLVPT